MGPNMLPPNPTYCVFNPKSQKWEPFSLSADYNLFSDHHNLSGDICDFDGNTYDKALFGFESFANNDFDVFKSDYETSHQPWGIGSSDLRPQNGLQVGIRNPEVLTSQIQSDVLPSLNEDESQQYQTQFLPQENTEGAIYSYLQSALESNLGLNRLPQDFEIENGSIWLRNRISPGLQIPVAKSSPEHDKHPSHPVRRRLTYGVLPNPSSARDDLGKGFNAITNPDTVPFDSPTAQHLDRIATYLRQNYDQISADSALLPSPPDYTEISPASTPCRQTKTKDCVSSPLVSPAGLKSKPLHRGSPTISEYGSCQHEHSYHSRSTPDSPGGIRSPPKTTQTPKTPRTSKYRHRKLEFVNYTPKHASKLLSDVAPSGSFKTRWRQERRSHEKMKELGEMAVQAIQGVGGDAIAFKEVFSRAISCRDGI